MMVYFFVVGMVNVLGYLLFEVKDNFCVGLVSGMVFWLGWFLDDLFIWLGLVDFELFLLLE